MADGCRLGSREVQLERERQHTEFAGTALSKTVSGMPLDRRRLFSSHSQAAQLYRFHSCAAIYRRVHILDSEGLAAYNF